MGMQMFFIAQKGEYSQESSRTLQRFVRQHGGLILMVTRNGPLVALDNSQADVVARHPLVSFIGPVMLNPRGIAAKHLQQIFADNLSKQLIIETPGGQEPEPQSGG